MLLHRSPSWVAILLATVVWSSAQAAEPETADQLVAKGVELRKKGDHAGALREFQAAHAKDPSGRTLAQMGIAEATLHRWVDAENHLSQALEATIPWVEKNRATLEQTLQTVRTHTAEISIYGTTGAVVTLEDKVVGRIPLPSVPRVNEGSVTVKVESSGYKPFVQTLPAKGGSQMIVTATLEPLPPEPAPPASAPAPSLVTATPSGGGDVSTTHPARRWGGIGLLTAGVVAATWGIVWVAVDGNSSWNDSSRVWNTRTPGWFILAGGVAASIGGGYLLYSSRHGEVQVAASPAGLMGRF
jgi:PEGA domain